MNAEERDRDRERDTEREREVKINKSLSFGPQQDNGQFLLVVAALVVVGEKKCI